MAAQMSWTDERIDRLKELWTQGMTASQIADELAGVSRNAVIGRAHRLGLQARPSPVKPNEHEEEAPPAESDAAEPRMPPAAEPAGDDELAPWEESGAPAAAEGETG